MRKLKLQMRITVDGFVAGPNGEEDWDVKADEKFWQLINELPDSSDTLLIGRKMAEKPFGKNTTLANGNLAQEISKLKNQDGKDIFVYGGAGFVAELIAGGHIDELTVLRYQSSNSN